ncbi:MAG TPA: NAD-dependent dihydropyrimidine dehydrogenase subunit PreA [Spirochaetaceae bacterium]|nr:NAD-dependent dihydropyrimidine dehydrogenase subunit PreA [Spirochaetaceae bacterium]
MASIKTANRIDMAGCMLCHNAPCAESCAKIKLGKALQSVWLDNIIGARLAIGKDNPCADCGTKECVKSCPRHIDIPKIISKTCEQKLSKPLSDKDWKRLETNICGIKIENPFLLSSSVVASSYDMCARALEAGWAGVCYKTICAFPIKETSPRFAAITDSANTISGFKNVEQLSDHSLEDNYATFRKLKKNYPGKFLLVSIMGRNEEEWARLAKESEDAGADALELNFSCPNMVEKGTGSEMGAHPELVEKYTAAAKKAVKIPVLSKLTPNVAKMSDAAEAAMKGGADGLAAINTIKSLIGTSPNIHRLSVGGYSGNAVKPIALRFVSEIAKNPACKNAHISGIGGIETWRDAMEFIAVGASSIQITTAVMQYGYRIIDDLKEGLALFLRDRGTSIKKICGIALNSIVDADEMPRDIVIYPKFNKSTCQGCLRCYVSCRDGGHQAISYGNDRKPLLDPKKCVGCHLCLYVCPTGSICSSEIEVKK